MQNWSVNTFRVLEEKPKERDCLEALGTEVRIISKWVLYEIGLDGVNWTDLAQDGDMCWAVVNLT
jgi:hypothetical protein